jgi:hypothetical protein
VDRCRRVVGGWAASGNPGRWRKYRPEHSCKRHEAPICCASFARCRNASGFSSGGRPYRRHIRVWLRSVEHNWKSQVGPS